MHKLVFFNNKGGVGKTTLCYNLGHWLAAQGHRVLLVDLDPQCNLTSHVLPEEELDKLYADRHVAPSTIFYPIQPIQRGLLSNRSVQSMAMAPGLHLIAGHLSLTAFEDMLSENWAKSMDEQPERALRITSLISNIIAGEAQKLQADYVLMDVGPNLGPLNRASLIGVDYIVMPVAADLFSLQGLRNVGEAVARWRAEWLNRHEKGQAIPRYHDENDLQLPNGKMQPLGYVIMQSGMRANRQVKAYQHWADRIPEVYAEAFPNAAVRELGVVKHYHSLIPLAMEARKPLFDLTVADGAIGSHMQAVGHARSTFQHLAHSIAQAIAQP